MQDMHIQGASLLASLQTIAPEKIRALTPQERRTMSTALDTISKGLSGKVVSPSAMTEAFCHVVELKKLMDMPRSPPIQTDGCIRRILNHLFEMTKGFTSNQIEKKIQLFGKKIESSQKKLQELQAQLTPLTQKKTMRENALKFWEDLKMTLDTSNKTSEQVTKSIQAKITQLAPSAAKDATYAKISKQLQSILDATGTDKDTQLTTYKKEIDTHIGSFKYRIELDLAKIQALATEIQKIQAPIDKFETMLAIENSMKTNVSLATEMTRMSCNPADFVRHVMDYEFTINGTAITASTSEEKINTIFSALDNITLPHTLQMKMQDDLKMYQTAPNNTATHFFDDNFSELSLPTKAVFLGGSQTVFANLELYFTNKLLTLRTKC